VDVTFVTEQQHAHYPADRHHLARWKEFSSPGLETVLKEKQELFATRRYLWQRLLTKAVRDGGPRNAAPKCIWENASIPLTGSLQYVRQADLLCGRRHLQTASPSTGRHQVKDAKKSPQMEVCVSPQNPSEPTNASYRWCLTKQKTTSCTKNTHKLAFFF